MFAHRLIILLSWVTLFGSNVVAQESESNQQTIEISVFPKSLNEKSYGMKLWPDSAELREGNAAVVLLRMTYERKRYLDEVASQFPEWLEAPIDDPTMLSELRFDYFHQQLKRAAYMRDAEWEYPINEEPQVWITLPDVQTGRVFVGNGLSLYMRKQIAEENPEVAHEALLVGLATSRHYSRTPFLVCNLIAASCSKNLLDQADILVQQDYENLFWAYQKLPQPLFNLENSISLEKNAIENSIPGLKEKPWPSHDEKGKWVDIASQLGSIANLSGISGFSGAAKLQKVFDYLKENWNEVGDETNGQADQMSGEELAVRFYILKSRYFSERTQAAFSLPPTQALKMIDETREEIKSLAQEIGVPEVESLFQDLSNAYTGLWAPSRKIVALQTIEAIRHYAGTHDGELPDSLDSIDDLPIPVDPFTGKPLEYKKGEETATLIMVNPTALARRENIGRFEHKYRIRVEK